MEAINANGNPTNFRAQVQLKASHKNANKDGSYSYSVARTNLNYLLNSLYVFLARDEDKVLYKMAEEVYAEREAKGTAWRTQDSITIRFEDELDAAAVVRLRDAAVTTHTHLRNLRLKLGTRGKKTRGRRAGRSKTPHSRDR